MFILLRIVSTFKKKKSLTNRNFEIIVFRCLSSFRKSQFYLFERVVMKPSVQSKILFQLRNNSIKRYLTSSTSSSSPTSFPPNPNIPLNFCHIVLSCEAETKVKTRVRHKKKVRGLQEKICTCYAIFKLNYLVFVSRANA